MDKREFTERLKLMYGPIFERAVEYIEVSPTEMIVKTGDGLVYLYDTWGDTIRHMPSGIDMNRDRFAMEVGERIRRIMDKKGITQEELSNKTGISQSVISRYILGKNILGLYTADKISRALGCNLDDLFYRY